jgi:hypothetical protein
MIMFSILITDRDQDLREAVIMKVVVVVHGEID